jgi:putative transposase
MGVGGTWFLRLTHTGLRGKYRPGVLDGQMLRLCERVPPKACADFCVELREFNGEPDHAHLPVFPPAKGALACARKRPQKCLRSQAPPTVHAPGEPGDHARPCLVSVLLAASCGGGSLSTIRQYTEQQQCLA